MSEPVGVKVSAGALERVGLTLERLRAAAVGRDSTIPQSRAIVLLHRTGFPNRHRDFEQVLEDQSQPAAVRYLAAIHLRRVGTPAAVDILTRNSDIRDDLVLAGVMKALGCIGDASALDAVRTVSQREETRAAAEACFAAILIAHRLRVEAEHRPSDTEGYVAPDLPCVRPMEASPADAEDAAACLYALADEPFGIEFAERTLVQLRCHRKTWMVALNREFSTNSGIRSLTTKRGFLGSVLRRGDHIRSYSVSYVMLASPAETQDVVDLVIYSTSGQPCFDGIVQVGSPDIQFSIRALARPGAVGVTATGTFNDGEIGIVTALSMPFVQVKKDAPANERSIASA